MTEMASCENSSKGSKERAYADIMIKIDDEIYHLDRLRLALKSDYFENLFIDDFGEKNRNMIEIPIMDSDTFSAIVDIIYSKSNSDVLPGLTADNYVSVLIAMDYFQMEIDFKKFLNFLQRVRSDSDEEIFRLYDFIVAKQFKYLLPDVFKYLSRNLERVGNRQEFLSLPFHHLAKVILSERTTSRNYEERCLITRPCIEWIFHDVENRLPLIVKLANVVRRRLGFITEINDGNLSIKLDNVEQPIKQETIQSWFYNMLVCAVEVNPDAPVVRQVEKYEEEDHPEIINKINEKEKLRKFLNNADFSDIVVKTAEKTYKLHRCILASESGYFSSTGSADREVSSTSTQNLNRHEEYAIDEIDLITFDLVVKHVYFNELLLTADNVVLVLKAADFLDIKKLLEKCQSWTRSNIKELSSESIVHLLNLTSEKESYRRDFVLFLWKELIISRPGVDISQFSSISLGMLEDVLSSSDNSFDGVGKILEVCGKWIMQDVANRYSLIPRVAFAINCCFLMDYDDSKFKIPTDFNDCCLELIQQELLKVLSATSLVLVPSLTKSAPSIGESTEIPVFVAFAKHNAACSILNMDMDVMATLCFPQLASFKRDSFLSRVPNISATTVNDNVFILFKIDNSTYFHVYNLSSKKFLSLTSFLPQYSIEEYYSSYCMLLNCCDEVYCSIEYWLEGRHKIMKYSTTFNRWVMVAQKSNVKNVKCTSDGKMLYRMFSKGDKKFAVQKYNVDKNQWYSMPDLSTTEGYFELIQLAILSNGDLAASSQNEVYSFNKREHKWKILLSLPRVSDYQYNSLFGKCYSFCPFYDKILYLCGGKLFCSPFSTSRWELIKDDILLNLLPNIASVHRPPIAETQPQP